MAKRAQTRIQLAAALQHAQAAAVGWAWMVWRKAVDKGARMTSILQAAAAKKQRRLLQSALARWKVAAAWRAHKRDVQGAALAKLIHR